LPDEGNAAADEDQPTGETQEDAPAETPPRDLPRSWTKDRTEVWNKLDPATQDILLEQDRKASAEVRRLQNEAADERKAIKAEREAAEKARQQYEAQLPALMQNFRTRSRTHLPTLEPSMMSPSCNEDPFRYLQWQAHQTKLQAVNAENERAKGQKSKSSNPSGRNTSTRKTLAAELIPDLADKEKGPALMKRAAERLSELGFKDGRTERSTQTASKSFPFTTIAFSNSSRIP
jgi:hypothetical protein